MTSPWQHWLYSLAPAAAILGGIATTFMRPSGRVTGAIQHLAGGVVFYAAAGELLPDANRGSVWPLIIGGPLGIAAMLALQMLAARSRGPVGLIGAAAVDSIIDGLTIGLGFSAGGRQGVLLTLALTVETLFIGLSIAGAFGHGRRVPIIASTAGIAVLVPGGALLAMAMAGLPRPVLSAAFAFGLVALLYLVTEELLVEAHRKPETPWGMALFLGGFPTLAIVDHLVKH